MLDESNIRTTNYCIKKQYDDDEIIQIDGSEASNGSLITTELAPDSNKLSEIEIIIMSEQKRLNYLK